LARACASTDVFPIKTNAPFLWRALDDPDFRAGRIDTGFIAVRGDALLPPAEPTDDMARQAAAALLVQEYYGEPTMLSIWEESLLEAPQKHPWRALLGFRANAAANRTVTVALDGALRTVELAESWEMQTVVGEPVFEGVAVNDDGLSFLASLPRIDGAATGLAGDGAITSPMPGRIIAVEVAAGASVARGQKLVTLEAMKMEHTLTAPFDGIVAELNATPGAQVSEGTLLVRVEAS
jgi:3-methylcrotonyl-CoA carboxylase alpha subunit